MSDQLSLTNAQEKNIIQAIAAAEKQTSAEIRIHIEDHCEDDPLQKADAVFHHLGMDQTERQNGVLIFIASEDKKAAIYGGKSIHERVEEGYWQDVLDMLLDHFKQGAFAEGIVQAIEEVGQKLKTYFPYQRGDVNELSNEISYNSSDES